MALIFCPDCGKSISDAAEICIGCGRPMQKLQKPEISESLPEKKETVLLENGNIAYRKERNSDTLGTGCIVQAIGLALIVFAFMSIVGPLLGLLLLVWGAQISRAKVYICGHCGNQISESSTICPACQFLIESSPASKLAEQIKLTVLTACTVVLIYAVYFYKP